MNRIHFPSPFVQRRIFRADVLRGRLQQVQTGINYGAGSSGRKDMKQSRALSLCRRPLEDVQPGGCVALTSTSKVRRG